MHTMTSSCIVKKYQFLYLPETTFLTRLLKAAPLAVFVLGSCGLSETFFDCDDFEIFSKNFEKLGFWVSNFSKCDF